MSERERQTHLEDHLDAVCYDANDPVGLAHWWQGLAGGEVTIDDDGDAVWQLGDSTRVLFLGVPEKKGDKVRLHLDIRAIDFDAAVGRALELGATRADDVYDGERWQVLRDPEGNEFCILRPTAD